MGTEAELFTRCQHAYLLYANKRIYYQTIPEFKSHKNWNDFVVVAKGSRENNIPVKVIQKFQEQLPQKELRRLKSFSC